MSKRVYALYVSTFQETRDALRAGDDARLRGLCAQVASRGGIESTVSLLAMSDAECGLPLRARGRILGEFWRTALASRSVPPTRTTPPHVRAA